MTKTTTGTGGFTLSADEVCPLCDASTVRVTERGWFVLELDRADELRGDAAEPQGDDAGFEFSCRSCGGAWH